MLVEKTILICFNNLYKNKNKDLIAKTDLGKIVQEFVKKIIYTSIVFGRV